MPIDERIRATWQRAHARGYLLLFFLLLIDLNYRLLYLGQSPREHWDLAAIWLAGVALVVGSVLGAGGFAGAGGRLRRVLGMVFCLNLGVHLVHSGDYSLGHVAETALSGALGLALVAAVVVAGTRLWEWRKGLAGQDAG